MIIFSVCLSSTIRDLKSTATFIDHNTAKNLCTSRERPSSASDKLERKELGITCRYHDSCSPFRSLLKLEVPIVIEEIQRFKNECRSSSRLVHSTRRIAIPQRESGGNDMRCLRSLLPTSTTFPTKSLNTNTSQDPENQHSLKRSSPNMGISSVSQSTNISSRITANTPKTILPLSMTRTAKRRMMR